jgi:hypothetical protein
MCKKISWRWVYMKFIIGYLSSKFKTSIIQNAIKEDYISLTLNKFGLLQSFILLQYIIINITIIMYYVSTI